DRDAGLEPADATQPKARLAIPEGIGQLTEWHVDIAQRAALKEIEAGRNDADDGVDTVAQLDGLTERGGGAAVFPLPQALADDGERRGADLVLAGREAASEDWLDPDHREELGRDELHLDRLCRVRAEKRSRAGPVDGHRRECLVVVPPVAEV